MAEGKGRGGRGAAILKVLNQMKEGFDNKQLLDNQPSIGRGRSQYIEIVKKKVEADERQPVGRGRASIDKLLSEMKISKELIGEKESLIRKEEKIAKEIEENIEIKPEQKIPQNIHGTSGTKVPISSNYMQITFEKDRGVFEYEVIFTPSVDSLNFRFKMLNSVLAEYGKVKTFDGVKLYLPRILEQKVTILEAIHPVTREHVKITIKYQSQKTLGECIHLLNVLFKKIMIELKFSRAVGKPHYYDNLNTFKLPLHRLEIWPGYETSICEFEGGVQICCDISHRVLRTQSVYEYMVENQFDKKKITQNIIGTSVLTKYNNRIYKIDDIMWDKKPKDTFTLTSGEDISFIQYYKNNYGIEILDINQPLLVSKMKRPPPSGSVDKVEVILCLIPELCFLTGLSEDMRKDFKVMKDVATYTRVNPQQRINSMLELFKHINNSPKCKELLKSWGLEISMNCRKIEARALVPEKIFVGNNQVIPGTKGADWNNALLRNQVLLPVNLHSWALIHIQKDMNFANTFCQLMYKVGPQIGISISQANVICIQNDRIETFLQALRRITEKQLVVIIVPTIREDRYAAIKTLCCVEKPIASQVIVSKTLSKPERQRSIIQKIALQINCKLGGALWTVHIPYENTMICGVDSCHIDSPNYCSVGAFVASLNSSYSKWFNFTSKQNSYELLNTLKVAMIAALNKYYENNKRYPDRIVLYRDGISDGMFPVAREHEIPQILSTFKNIHPNYNPKFIFIVCQKRINTRLFKIEQNSHSNPDPGTILDHTVTKKHLYDFFLVSQNVRQGTVTPTHYIVLHDSGNTPPDQIQRLTYKMSHLYYNWPGTVRVPAPCQYAHKLAFLVGKYIRRQPSDTLNDRLYFI